MDIDLVCKLIQKEIFISKTNTWPIIKNRSNKTEFLLLEEKKKVEIFSLMEPKLYASRLKSVEDKMGTEWHLFSDIGSNNGNGWASISQAARKHNGELKSLPNIANLFISS